MVLWPASPAGRWGRKLLAARLRRKLHRTGSPEPVAIDTGGGTARPTNDLPEQRVRVHGENAIGHAKATRELLGQTPIGPRLALRFDDAVREL
jgi:hypothetical protein